MSWRLWLGPIRCIHGEETVSYKSTANPQIVNSRGPIRGAPGLCHFLSITAKQAFDLFKEIEARM